MPRDEQTAEIISLHSTADTEKWSGEDDLEFTFEDLRCYLQNPGQRDPRISQFEAHKALNELAALYPDAVQCVSRVYDHFLRRCAKSTLSKSEFMLVDTVYDRTLSWAWSDGIKISETLSARGLANGIRPHGKDDDRSVTWIGDAGFLSDVRGLPIFAGLNMDRNTIRNGLRSLENRGLIGRLSWGNAGQEINAYHIGVDWVGIILGLHEFTDFPTSQEKEAQWFTAQAVIRGRVTDDLEAEMVKRRKDRLRKRWN